MIDSSRGFQAPDAVPACAGRGATFAGGWHLSLPIVSWQTSLRDGTRGAQFRGLKAPATFSHRSAMEEAVASPTEWVLLSVIDWRIDS